MCLERGNRQFCALLDHLPDDYNLLFFHMPLCPICDTEVDVDEFDVDRDDELSCAECGANLTVTAVSPVELGASSANGNDSDDHFEEETDD